jgi:hypothetical protein
MDVSRVDAEQQSLDRAGATLQAIEPRGPEFRWPDGRRALVETVIAGATLTGTLSRQFAESRSVVAPIRSFSLAAF